MNDQPQSREIIFAYRPLNTIFQKGISKFRKNKRWPCEATRHWVLQIGDEYIWELVTEKLFKVVDWACGPKSDDHQDWDGSGWTKESLGFTELSDAEIARQAGEVIDYMKTQYGAYNSKRNNCQVFVAHLLSLVINTPGDAEALKQRTGHYTRKVESKLCRLSQRVVHISGFDTTPSPTGSLNIDQETLIGIDAQGEPRDNLTKADPVEASPSPHPPSLPRAQNKRHPAIRRGLDGQFHKLDKASTANR